MFDFFLNKETLKTEMGGPYWLALTRMYGIVEGDIIHFKFLTSENKFLFTVYNNLGVEKSANLDNAGMLLQTLKPKVLVWYYFCYVRLISDILTIFFLNKAVGGSI